MADGFDEGIAAPFRLLLRIPVPWVFVLVYLIGVMIEAGWPLPGGSLIGATAAVAYGGIVFSIGALIAGWGLYTFRKARTTTVPGRVSAALVTGGPYRFSRNPMYVGLVIAYVGEATLLRQLWPLILLPLVVGYVNWTVIPLEQRKLTEVFGDEYTRYRKRVRRWL